MKSLLCDLIGLMSRKADIGSELGWLRVLVPHHSGHVVELIELFLKALKDMLLGFPRVSSLGPRGQALGPASSASLVELPTHQHCTEHFG